MHTLKRGHVGGSTVIGGGADHARGLVFSYDKCYKYKSTPESIQRRPAPENTYTSVGGLNLHSLGGREQTPPA